MVSAGAVDREALSRRVLGDPEALARLEAIVHPLVKAERDGFLSKARSTGADVAVIEVQLLFEVGVHEDTDAVVVVSAPEEQQRERVLSRPRMTEERLEQILARQMPDADKRAKADFVIDTGRGIDHARVRVFEILEELKK